MTDTQNSAGVPDLLEYLRDPPFGGNRHFGSLYGRKAMMEAAARITALEAHIAAEPDRMREVVERCAKVAEDCRPPTAWDEHIEIAELYGFSLASDQIAAAIRAQEIKP